MREHEYLIDWLHKVESDPKDVRKVSKRLPSIVSELYFEHRLSSRQDLGLHAPFSFGWTVRYDRKSKTRHWFKVSERDEEISPDQRELNTRHQINKAFTSAIANVNGGDRFFIVIHEVKMDEGNKPLVTLNILEIEIAFGAVKKKDDQSYADNLGKEITELVNNALQERVVCEPAQTITPWLSTMKLPSLRRLLATRCFMNFSHLYLTDIDAVGLSHLGQLQVVEFKRKGPARGVGYRLVTSPDSTSGISRYLKEIMVLKSISPENIREKLGDTTYVTKVVSDCFGLDTSHAKNADLCNRAEITYRYLIWNTTETDPEKLFTTELKPKNASEFFVLDVAPSHIDKISMTFGDDSGTYTSDTRFQLMISVDKFSIIYNEIDDD